MSDNDKDDRLQRVVVHTHGKNHKVMPDGEVMHHEDGVLQDITGSTYVRRTPDEWRREYALTEHQPKNRRSRRD